MVANTTTLGLDKIRMDKDRLLGILRANKEKHIREVAAAKKVWIQSVIDELEKQLYFAKQKRDGEVAEKFNIHVGDRLQEPKDRSKSYSSVINRLEHSIDKVVFLNEREFNQYVEDEWAWKSGHSELMSNYGQARL